MRDCCPGTRPGYLELEQEKEHFYNCLNLNLEFIFSVEWYQLLVVVRDNERLIKTLKTLDLS